MDTEKDENLETTETEQEPQPATMRVIYYVLGTVGLVATIALARFLSGGFSQTAEITEPETYMAVVEEAPQVVPLSTEELNDLYDSVKLEVAEESKDDGDGEEKEAYLSPIDFAGLQAVNKDVYAWLTVAGTEIDYPLLQHPIDDTYYLNYRIDGSYGLPGCIYTESLNARDFSDQNTVIYGHNMKDGSQFAQLHKFRERGFFDDNREVVIYLPDRELHYQIFAAYIYDDRHLLYSFNFADPRVYAKYLEAIFDRDDNRSLVDKGIAVTADDRIITLATCIANEGDKRLLVQAVLVNPEDIE
jgi:sortase B